MATDITGLLTGVSKRGIDPLTGGSFGQRVLARQQQNIDAMQRGLRGLITGDPSSPQEKIQLGIAEGIRNFDTKTPQEQEGLIRALQATGQTGLAGQLAGRLEKQKELNLNKDLATRLYPDLGWASEFAGRGVPLNIIKQLASDTNKDRMELYNYTKSTYGEKTANSLKPLILNGSVKAQDIPRLVPDKDKAGSLKNFAIIDDDGNRSQMTVIMKSDDSFSDLQGNPIVLPTSAQLMTVGKTPQDMEFERNQNGDLVARLTEKDREKIVKELEKSRQKVAELKKIGTEELENALTFQGKMKIYTGGLSSYFNLAGMTEDTGYALLDDVNEYLVGLEEFGGKATLILDVLESYFQKRRHDITGAQAAVSEIKDLRKFLLSRESTPNAAKSRISKLIELADNDIARYQNMLENNQLSFEAFLNETEEGQEGVTITPENPPPPENIPISNESILNNFFEKYLPNFK